ncbi:MAG: hypothetical protein QOJ07_664, partial [Thermoleophilaceae bacterium]|nr:hypothetical protein [Thermoleophilaceae bacterium]
ARAARSTPAARADARRRHAARERRLRARVRKLSGCLGSLSEQDRRVLELRAGLAGAGPRTPAQVAAELGIDRGNYGRVERRALRRLGAAARSGGCGTAVGGGAAPTGPGGAAQARDMAAQIASMPRLQPATLAGTPRLMDPSALAPRSGVRGARASGGTDAQPATEPARPQVGATIGRTARALVAAGSGDSFPALPWLLAAAALALVAALALTVRRRDDHLAAATAAPPQSPATAISPAPERPPVPAWAPPVAPPTPEPSPSTSAPASPVRTDPDHPTGDTVATESSSLGSAAPDVSPGDTAAAPGPPAAPAADGAAAGAPPPTPVDDQPTVVSRRRSGGIVGAVSPAARGATRVAGSAVTSARELLREAARRARERDS